MSRSNCTGDLFAGKEFCDLGVGLVEIRRERDETCVDSKSTARIGTQRNYTHNGQSVERNHNLRFFSAANIADDSGEFRFGFAEVEGLHTRQTSN